MPQLISAQSKQRCFPLFDRGSFRLPQWTGDRLPLDSRWRSSVEVDHQIHNVSCSYAAFQLAIRSHFRFCFCNLSYPNSGSSRSHLWRSYSFRQLRSPYRFSKRLRRERFHHIQSRDCLLLSSRNMTKGTIRNHAVHPLREVTLSVKTRSQTSLICYYCQSYDG